MSADPVSNCTPSYNRALHAAAWAVALAIFPLIWMGGLVTSHGAGMAVPDWPNSFGYNMFALPFPMWLGQYAGGAFYEHTHRLLGTLAGLMTVLLVCQAYGTARRPRVRRVLGWNALIWSAVAIVVALSAFALEVAGTITHDTARLAGHFLSGFGSLGILCFIAWTARRIESRTWLRRSTLALLVLVIIQGLLGGFRVQENNIGLALLHGVSGQIVFAASAGLCVLSSRWWLTRATSDAPAAKAARELARLSAIAIGLILVQLILGAMMRHDPRRNPLTGAGVGLAIPDWPLHYGRVLPPLSSDQLAEINRLRTTQYNLPALEGISPVYLHFAHRLGAYATLGHILQLSVFALQKLRGRRGLVGPAVLMGVLVLVQVGLGVTTVLLRKPADIATAHQANGSLLLAIATVLFVRALREYASRDRVARSAGESTPTTAGQTAAGSPALAGGV